MVTLQEITITKEHSLHSGRWNFDLNGKPFGQIWTYTKRNGFKFRYHAKTLAGAYADFATYAEAETFMRGEM